MTDSGRLQGVHHKYVATSTGQSQMHRIATAMLIVAAVLVLNAGMLRDAFAGEMIVQPAQVEVKAAKVLSLLVILEALRQAPVRPDSQKV